MKKWTRVCNYTNGTVYALGKHRKLVIPDHPDIFFEMDTKEIRWRPGTVDRRQTGRTRKSGIK